MFPYYIYTQPFVPENHHIADVTDCDMWGHLPPDSLGICGDCGETVPKTHSEDADDLWTTR